MSEAPPFSLYVPAGHGSNDMLTLTAPSFGQKPPLGQSEQALAPVSEEKVPAGHAVHCERALSLLYVPGMQGAHTVSVVAVQSPTTNSPSVHGEHSLHTVAPVSFWYLPMAHERHIG